jgi:protein TonB
MMEAQPLAPRRVVRPKAFGRPALVRAVRRRRDVRPPTRSSAPPSASALTVVDVVRAMFERPTVRAIVFAALSAAALHAGAGAAGLRVRPVARKHRVDFAAVAVADPVDVLPEDAPVPPPPAPAAKQSIPAAHAPSTPTSTPAVESATATVAAPVVAGVAGGVAGFAFAGSGEVGAPMASTTPVATATTVPVTTPARPLRRSPPRFPPDARRDGRAGVVVLQLRIDETGAVVDVRVAQSDPPGVFDAAAIESVRSWTFAPATTEGHAVASWVRQTIHFTLEDS